MSYFTSLDDRQRLHSRPPVAPSHTLSAAIEAQPTLEIQPLKTSAPAWSTSGTPPWSTATRPLSDIRELTEPSLVDITNRRPSLRSGLNKNPAASHSRNASRQSHRRNDSQHSHHRAGSLSRKDSIIDRPGPTHVQRDDARGRRSPIQSPSTPGDESSIYSVPPVNVPPRSSSQKRSASQSKNPILDAPPRSHGFTIPNRGGSRSPVKELAARLDPVSLDSSRRIPSRTFVRSPQPIDILDAPTHRHPRISIDLHISASLFVGGGSIEGHVRVNVDGAERIRHKRAIAMSRMSVDLVGVEEITGSKRFVFLNLATELVDAENPPPHNMVESLKQLSPIDPFWLLAPSISSVPFLLSLPLDVGPPPFQSKSARIRYILCVSIFIRDQGRTYLVRSSQDVSVLSVYDPEKALMSLPSPLTATDEWTRARETYNERIRVTGGLHRQVWVSGQNIFVDVHISNHSRKTIKRVELQLERDVLYYKHAAAATMEKSASQARIFDANERVILTKVVYRQGVGAWNGVPAHSTDVRTYDLELPRGHATVKCGKFFEVRYFLNISVASSHSKLVTVQLPIVLIHMNSLDVVPNSVAQVAAAIEDKRTMAVEQHLPHSLARRSSRARNIARRPSNVQGRAFSAPRKQSLDRMRAEAEDLSQLGQILDSSPRRYAAGPVGHQQRFGSSFEYHTPPSNRKGRVLYGDDLVEIQRQLRHVRSNETNRSAYSAAAARSKVVVPNRMNSRTSQRAVGGHTSVGFREAEVEEPEVSALGLKSTSSAAGVVKDRGRIPGAARVRNFQFSGRERSKSKEGWRRWFGGDEAKDSWV